ncbi:MAG: hypothetical protein IPM14_15300 [bacterium]|nr:hypothetical protein [bacterium]
MLYPVPEDKKVDKVVGVESEASYLGDVGKSVKCWLCSGKNLESFRRRKESQTTQLEYGLDKMKYTRCNQQGDKSFKFIR